ncbi:short-chain dehydrogenase of unknown substrate specificity [Sanguibacter keddieii DSM 10542]|uniref:Short-chain dehydrogenase n=1 Tax=Sanguibacter keddieii (strain ATCC 51767 / DSM 10542 / NCFB 3025 / ST-74) TaxID=446469 RepID=D1BHF2_SANKS|nr:SDR family NAD(P)-dependent oxidoreductase [Sanguibacter keddieii]ACZ21872.1 short-chain dehydrogenase of unknown substrate specificity [Sanguibacter keddieii DSM 10542]
MATALITGGTSGIGAAFAEALAARGVDLVLVARDEGRLTDSATRLASTHGITVDTLRADLAVRADVERVAARLEDTTRPVELLVNNAGSGVRTPLVSRDVASHDLGFDVMCRAVLVLGGAAGRAMSARGSGAIINVSSLQSLFTTGSYAAMKAWVTSYSQGLSVELHGTGVTVTAVLPGWVRTDWHARDGERRSSVPGWLWTEPADVALAALRDSARGRVVSVPSRRYRVIGWLARHLPRATVRQISGRISSSRRDSPPDTSPPTASPPTASPGTDAPTRTVRTEDS